MHSLYTEYADRGLVMALAVIDGNAGADATQSDLESIAAYYEPDFPALIDPSGSTYYGWGGGYGDQEVVLLAPGGEVIAKAVTASALDLELLEDLL